MIVLATAIISGLEIPRRQRAPHMRRVRCRFCFGEVVLKHKSQPQRWLLEKFRKVTRYMYNKSAALTSSRENNQGNSQYRPGVRRPYKSPVIDARLFYDPSDGRKWKRRCEQKRIVWIAFLDISHGSLKTCALEKQIGRLKGIPPRTVRWIIRLLRTQGFCRDVRKHGTYDALERELLPDRLGKYPVPDSESGRTGTRESCRTSTRESCRVNAFKKRQGEQVKSSKKSEDCVLPASAITPCQESRKQENQDPSRPVLRESCAAVRPAATSPRPKARKSLEENLAVCVERDCISLSTHMKYDPRWNRDRAAWEADRKFDVQKWNEASRYVRYSLNRPIPCLSVDFLDLLQEAVEIGIERGMSPARICMRTIDLCIRERVPFPPDFRKHKDQLWAKEQAARRVAA